MEPVTSSIKAVLMPWIIATLAAGVALLAPIYALMGAVGFLIFTDMVTGIAAANRRGEPLTSKALSRTVWKALVYQLAVISGFAMEHLLGGAGVLPVAKLCAAAIGLVEFRSLMENVQTLTGVNLRAVVAKVSEIGRELPPPPKE